MTDPVNKFLPLHFLDGFEVCSFKTRKSQGLPLSQNSSQLITWAHKCHSLFLSSILSMLPESPLQNYYIRTNHDQNTTI